MLAGEVVGADGAVVDGGDGAAAGADVYLYRDLPDEVPVPFDIPVLYRDDDIVVVDKPHFLATMPRGRARRADGAGAAAAGTGSAGAVARRTGWTG